MIVPYYNIRKEFKRIEKSFVKSIRKIGHSGNFILGQNTINFEKKLKKIIGSNNIIAVANGTDALELSIAALNIPAGSEIISVSNTFISTINAILRNGCKPVLCDIDETYNIDPFKIEKLITLKTKAIIAVHLNGMPCCMSKINSIAKKNNLKVIEDSAQSILSEYANKKIGNSKNLNCFSLHPTKNLGGLMDGGFISTNDKKISKKLRIMRNHGLKDRGIVKVVGQNSRLSEINANALLKKLKFIKSDTKYKIKLAQIYDRILDKNYVVTPNYGCCKKITHTYHRYVIRTKYRADLIKYLNHKKIETKIHYEKNIHQQKIMSKKIKIPFKLKFTEQVSKENLSLPINQFLKPDQVMYVANSINDFFRKKNIKFKF